MINRIGGTSVMPPKTQIPKEKILDTALQLVIREGYEVINIKRLAKELGCSTQPISWSFGNMEAFRGELFRYALNYMNSKMRPNGTNPVAALFSVGETYVNMAFDEPNLIRYLRKDSKGLVNLGGIGAVFDEEKNKSLREALSRVVGISDEKVREFMDTVVIYTQGLVTFIIDGTITVSREEAMRMLEGVGVMHLVYAGIPYERASVLFKD